LEIHHSAISMKKVSKMKKLLIGFLALGSISAYAINIKQLEHLNKAEIKYSNYATFKREPFYTASLSSSNPRVNKVLYAFNIKDHDQGVSQVAFEFYVCEIYKTPYPALIKESRDFFTNMTKKIFNSDLNIPESAFDNSKSISYLNITHPFKKVRITRGQYKCDSTGGDGYRLDLFL
jgi:hypothetical protein